MSKVNIKNEQVKRKFFKWLKEADGCCDSTVNNIEKAILIYEDFTKQADLNTFNSNKAEDFKKWIKEREFRGKIISITTYHTYLRYLKKFFSWLSWQTGYKSKITPDIIRYLNISLKDERIATQNAPRNYPLLEYVIKLADSIKITSEIDLRDRALISFTLLSGMRDKAISTLPLGCFNEETFIISQNPKQGVQTKFSKYIQTTLFKFNDKLVQYVLDWTKHLREKGFGSQDPLFPRSKMKQSENALSFEESSEVEPIFWHNANRIREIFKTRCKNAVLPYFPPHTYRHLAVSLALKNCKNGEQIKAISQNFGHEHVVTTLCSYATYDPNRLSQILSNMDFSGKPKETLEEKIDKLLQQNKNNS